MMPTLSARYGLSPTDIRALTVDELRAYLEALDD